MQNDQIMWQNFEKHYIRTYRCESLAETRHFRQLLNRVTPILNNAGSIMKMVDVIQQSKFMISDFVLIFQQPQIRYKDLELGCSPFSTRKIFSQLNRDSVFKGSGRAFEALESTWAIDLNNTRPNRAESALIFLWLSMIIIYDS